MTRLNLKQIKFLVQQTLEEDLGRSGDITTKLVVDSRQKVRARIVSRQKGVLAGIGLAGSVFKAVDHKINFKTNLKDGNRFEKGQVITLLRGPASGILTAERTALNFLGRLSGIATLTAEFVQKVRPYPVKIFDTRKTTPGLRYLEKYAVRCGGGYNHRMGLYDQILIKDNHIEALRHNVQQGEYTDCTGDIPCKRRSNPKTVSRAETISLILKSLKRKKIAGLKVEIEVERLDELYLALAEQPDIIMLDNMSRQQIKKAVSLRNKYYPNVGKKRPLLEVSGGVTPARASKLAAYGVDMISIGALTHSAKAIDFSLEIE